MCTSSTEHLVPDFTMAHLRRQGAACRFQTIATSGKIRRKVLELVSEGVKQALMEDVSIGTHSATSAVGK